MSQRDLFATHTPLVSGLSLVEEAVDSRTERALVAAVDASPLAPFRLGQWIGKRLTCSYGSAYDYARGRLADAPPLPEWLVRLREAIVPRLHREPAHFVQALVTRYDPGAGIGWHRDRPQYGEVIGLSLGAPAKLRLRQRSVAGFARATLELPPRSAYLLSGEVREHWEHSIAPMDRARLSVTFRTLRHDKRKSAIANELHSL